MTVAAFMRYLRARVRARHAAHIQGEDPEVELYDGIVRIFDQRGESMSMRGPLPRQLRALATMLELCADEIERRACE
jgi:hypothetical protein